MVRKKRKEDPKIKRALINRHNQIKLKMLQTILTRFYNLFFSNSILKRVNITQIRNKKMMTISFLNF